MDNFGDLAPSEQSQIRNFLNSVEGDMQRTGAPASNIAAVRDALMEQIVEARAEAGDGADLHQILKSIDPPYSFAETETVATPAAVSGEAALIGKLSLGFAIFGVAAVVLAQFGGKDIADRVGGPAFLFSEILAICLGFLARRTAIGQAGLVCGIACLALLTVVIALGG
jgi:hypothetical protein